MATLLGGYIFIKLLGFFIVLALIAFLLWGRRRV